MKSKNTFITNDTFIRFVYKFFKNFNFDNKEYLEQVKNEYFKSVENKELSMFAAEPYLRKIFMNNGFCKNRPDKISHWKSIGYSDINSIRSEAYRYCKNNGKYKKLVFDNDDFEIKKLLKEILTVFNFDNEQYYDYVKNKLFDGVIFISYIPAKKKIYHHKLTDEIRDSDILMIDEHVIGILRISDSFFKDKNFLKIEKINKINESIQKIKNTTESRIML